MGILLAESPLSSTMGWVLSSKRCVNLQSLVAKLPHLQMRTGWLWGMRELIACGPVSLPSWPFLCLPCTLEEAISKQISLCMPMFPAQAEKDPPLAPATYLVREWWLELADIQGADQRDAVHGNPILVPEVSAELPEAEAQLHHGGWWSLSCPEADTGSLHTGHLADVPPAGPGQRGFREDWPQCSSYQSWGGL